MLIYTSSEVVREVVNDEQEFVLERELVVNFEAGGLTNQYPLGKFTSESDLLKLEDNICEIINDTLSLAGVEFEREGKNTFIFD